MLHKVMDKLDAPTLNTVFIECEKDLLMGRSAQRKCGRVHSKMNVIYGLALNHHWSRAPPHTRSSRTHMCTAVHRIIVFHTRIILQSYIQQCCCFPIRCAHPLPFCATFCPPQSTHIVSDFLVFFGGFSHF